MLETAIMSVCLFCLGFGVGIFLRTWWWVGCLVGLGMAGPFAGVLRVQGDWCCPEAFVFYGTICGAFRFELAPYWFKARESASGGLRGLFARLMEGLRREAPADGPDDAFSGPNPDEVRRREHEAEMERQRAELEREREELRCQRESAAGGRAKQDPAAGAAAEHRRRELDEREERLRRERASFEAEKTVKRTRDPYEVLGVKRGATLEQIRKIYRKLALAYHEDVSKGVAIDGRMAELNDAMDRIEKELRR